MKICKRGEGRRHRARESQASSGTGKSASFAGGNVCFGSHVEEWQWGANSWGWTLDGAPVRIGGWGWIILFGRWKPAQQRSLSLERSSAYKALGRAQRVSHCFMRPPCQARSNSPPPNTIQHTLSSHLLSPMCDTHRRHTWKPGPRADFVLTFLVVELAQSPGCSLLPGLVSLAPSLITLEKAIKPGRAEQFPFMLLNVPFVPLYAAHTYTSIPASEHLSLHLPLHLLCPEQVEDPSWPLSDFPCWLLTGTSLLSQLLHCSHCALLLLIWESGLGKGFLKPTITV